MLLSLVLSACGMEQVSLFEKEPAVAVTGGVDAGGGTEPVVTGGAEASGGDASGGVGGALASGGAEATGGVEATGGTVAVVPPKVLLVVDENPISTDRAVEERLTGLGAEVTRISELVVKPADVEGYDLFIVSPSADGVDTPASLNNVAVPMILLEPAVTARMGFGAMASQSASQTVNVVRPAHALAAGKTGEVTVCSSEVILQGNQALASASVLDSASGNHSALFVHEKGETVGIELPARRVGLSLIKLAGCQTEASWEFFDAAFEYLLGD